MPTWASIAIGAAAAIVVVIGAFVLWRQAQTRRLKQRFGPEYDRVIADEPTRREAEALLREREQRHAEFDIRPLDEEAADRYRARWRDVQARFVDDPADAVGEADALIQVVMRDRGYPVEDFDTRAADLSIDYPDVVENYRAAHGIAVGHDHADTEALRIAFKHYRALFEELLEVREREGATKPA